MHFISRVAKLYNDMQEGCHKRAVVLSNLDDVLNGQCKRPEFDNMQWTRQKLIAIKIQMRNRFN